MNGRNIFSSDCPGGKTIGSRCILQCMGGYKFSDDSTSKTAVCKLSDDGESATWGLDDLPKCIGKPVVCSIRVRGGGGLIDKNIDSHVSCRQLPN